MKPDVVSVQVHVQLGVLEVVHIIAKVGVDVAAKEVVTVHALGPVLVLVEMIVLEVVVLVAEETAEVLVAVAV